ncbi:MAG: peptidoglycan editing factor PgeF [Ruminococcaceae bacterium]|nr:peptidoglycan editing factor PgeF [Oscillospiraceae bacterium]
MFRPVRAENGVVFYRSDMLGEVIHGFSARIGGVSRLTHTACLNLAFGRGDEDETVLKNTELFADAVGFDAKRLVSVPQIHSSRIFTVTEDMLGEGVYRKATAEGDGYIITERGMFAAVKTADCVPVLLYDPAEKICAAVHAGWRGTFALIAAGAVGRMKELGCKADNIRVAIGPAIVGACYEVGKEVADAAIGALGEKAEHVLVRGRSEGKYLCDLKTANSIILCNAGVKKENIDVCGLCTHCERETFYSHRASGGVRGTMMSVIGMK